jgi:hypothetical protein
MPSPQDEPQIFTPKVKQQLKNTALQNGIQTLASLLRDLYYESQARKQGMSFDDYCRAYHKVPRNTTVDDYLAEKLRPTVIEVIDDCVDTARAVRDVGAYLSRKTSEAADTAVNNVRRLLGI